MDKKENINLLVALRVEFPNTLPEITEETEFYSRSPLGMWIVKPTPDFSGAWVPAGDFAGDLEMAFVALERFCKEHSFGYSLYKRDYYVGGPYCCELDDGARTFEGFGETMPAAICQVIILASEWEGQG